MTRESAITAAKKAFDGRCIFTGLSGADGAHIYPAGDFPALADCEWNIVPIVRQCHSVRGQPCFDFRQVDGIDIVRPVPERLWMVVNMMPEEMWDYRSVVTRRLQLLALECDKVGVPYRGWFTNPPDYTALRLRGRE